MIGEDAPERRRASRTIRSPASPELGRIARTPRPILPLLAALALSGAACTGTGGFPSAEEAGFDALEADGTAPGVGAAPAPAGAPPRLDLATDPRVLASVDEWYLPVGPDCRLYVREFGLGDTVVVIHGGFGAEHSYLLDAVAGLEAEFHFVFYDQRGSLRSPCPDSTATVPRHVADLDRLVTAMGSGPVALLGHSMGTFIALRYLEEHPESVRAMVLLAPVQPWAPETEDERRRYASEQEAFGRWAEARKAATLAAEGLDRPDSLLTPRERTHKWRIGFASGNVYDLALWRSVKGGGAFYDPDAGGAAARTMGTWDFSGALERHPGPIRFIMGDHDLIGFGGELHRLMLERVAGVEFELVAGGGHNLWIDRPTELRRLLRAGLRRP